jgi:hypothetical protein
MITVSVCSRGWVAVNKKKVNLILDLDEETSGITNVK